MKVRPKAARPKLPPWIRVKISCGGERDRVADVLDGLGLHTVCRSAGCPNLGECWHRGTATFMILGGKCTRKCRFCGVEHDCRPDAPDPSEPAKVAEAVERLKLGYVVITSVTRDDLPDGGAGHFAAAVSAVRARLPCVKIEVLTPDFKGDFAAVRTVAASVPDVFNHNLETVERLSPMIRSGADYGRSLSVLSEARRLAEGTPMLVKSGLMVGLGETDAEVERTIGDLYSAGVQMLTIGQYLPPGPDSWPLERYVEPGVFAVWKTLAESMGFVQVASAPLVRSSYHAEQSWEASSGPEQGDDLKGGCR